MGALKNACHDEIELRRAVEDGGFEVVTGCHFTMTEDDLCDGRNKLGIKVNVPLNVPLCSSCDGEIVDGVCASCEIIHADLLPPELKRTGTGAWL